VLDGVSLDVARGEVVAVLGPNGAGKTTTVEILEGYRAADEGEVSVLGVDPARGGPAWRARVGLMLQGGGVDPRMSPAEAIALYRSFHAAPRGVDELLDLVGLREVARTRYRRLSGGERQRVGLALALVGRPEVLFLDEPTAGMDPAARAATRGLIRDLAGGGVAILMTTHDLGDVERCADRVAMLARGRIVAEGTPDELTGAGRGLRLRTAGGVSVEGLQRSLASRWPAARVTGDGAGWLAVDGADPEPALVAAVAAWAAGSGALITELRAGSASLEERYLQLTGDADVGT
jgi:ABC-2 type transport system ATP-binding protein